MCIAILNKEGVLDRGTLHECYLNNPDGSGIGWIDSDDKLQVIKFGENFEELSDDVIVIPSSEHAVDISQMAYEMICLSLPIRRVHPDDENGNTTCDEEVLKRIEEMTPNEDVDPRWDNLLKINFEN